MDRRHFLKTVGAGSLGLAALPELRDLVAPSSVAAVGHRRRSFFSFVSFSQANTLDGVQHRWGNQGAGTFSASGVEAWGSFTHIDNAPSGTPKPVLAKGTWTAKRVVNFAPTGTYGTILASILDLDVEVNRIEPSPLVRPAKLRLVCNIGPAGITTGQPEGWFLSIPGTPFTKTGPGGQYKPLDPIIGITHIGVDPATGTGIEVVAFDPAWEQEFRAAHGGRAPTPQDRADRLWSLDFLALNGRGPTGEEWLAHWNELQAWWAT